MNDKSSQLLPSWVPFNRTQGLASIQQTNKHRGRLLLQKAHSNSCCAVQKWSIQIKQIGRSQKDLKVLGPPTKFTQRRPARFINLLYFWHYTLCLFSFRVSYEYPWHVSPPILDELVNAHMNNNAVVQCFPYPESH